MSLEQARRGAVQLTTAAAVVAAVATLAVTFLPFLRFAYDAPRLHIVLETGNAVIALIVSYLAYGRFRVSGRARDLLLALALVVLAVANLPLTAVPSALEGDLERGSTWAGIGVRLLGTLLVAAAAFVSPDRGVAPRRAAALASAVASTVLAVVVLCLLLGDGLPMPIDREAPLGDGTVPVVAGHPLLLVTQAVGLAAYALAAVSFTRQAARVPDELLRYLGAGCAVAAFSRVNYLLFPSLYSDFVYTGDLLRLAFYVMLLRGATREIATYWAARSEAAVLEERRRMARDLHDGLTQELTYIWSQTGQLAKRPGDPVLVERISGAAGRALDESRRAIAALTRPLDEGFDAVLRQQVDQMASRYDVEATADLDALASVTPQQCEELLRITGEAFRNAVRHGRASHVAVQLNGSPLSLEIRDDGQGFDTTASNSGFGLISMRERAEGLGARFSVSSETSGGTRVKVEWP